MSPWREKDMISIYDSAAQIAFASERVSRVSVLPSRGWQFQAPATSPTQHER